MMIRSGRGICSLKQAMETPKYSKICNPFLKVYPYALE